MGMDSGRSLLPMAQAKRTTYNFQNNDNTGCKIMFAQMFRFTLKFHLFFRSIVIDLLYISFSLDLLCFSFSLDLLYIAYSLDLLYITFS